MLLFFFLSSYITFPFPRWALAGKHFSVNYTTDLLLSFCFIKERFRLRGERKAPSHCTCVSPNHFSCVELGSRKPQLPPPPSLQSPRTHIDAVPQALSSGCGCLSREGAEHKGMPHIRPRRSWGRPFSAALATGCCEKEWAGGVQIAISPGSSEERGGAAAPLPWQLPPVRVRDWTASPGLKGGDVTSCALCIVGLHTQAVYLFQFTQRRSKEGSERHRETYCCCCY